MAELPELQDLPDSQTLLGGRSLGADLLIGAALFLIVVLAVLFATGEDTSFIYIDF